MRVNIARVWEDSDYEKFRQMCKSSVGWKEVYSKKNCKIWVQPMPNSTNQMIKAAAVFNDVCASVVFDVLHDSAYRSKWDKYMAAQKDIGLINPNNDIGYYAVHSIPPVRSRDFVMQRSWLDVGDEKLICSHSVCHEDFPPNKAYIRGTVFLAGYLIESNGEDGCHVTYVSHSDPKGKLPTWLVNRVSKSVAPKMIKKLHKACLAYPQWKSEHDEHWKPWKYADQQFLFVVVPIEEEITVPIAEMHNSIDLPRVDLAKCQPKEFEQEIIDESKLEGVQDVEEDEE